LHLSHLHDLPALLTAHYLSDHMEKELSGVQTFMYSVVAPRELLTVTARYAASMVFYMDGSLLDGCAGFAYHRTGEGSFFLYYNYIRCFLGRSSKILQTRLQ
jgi:hypothetical protein